MGTPGTHSRKQRTISVGIAEGERIEFALGDGVVRAAIVAGEGVAIGGEVRQEWVFTPGQIAGQAGNDGALGVSAVIPGTPAVIPGTPAIMPGTPAVMPGSTGHLTPYFTLKGVEIGKGFHWQRRQDQSFRGSLRLIAREGRVIAINVVGIEDYLQCVIASEMSPTAGFEFLKAHAVISRSWLLAQLDKRDEVREEGYSAVDRDTPDELIRWQDREDHQYYDFCADDHCQRYQGIPMAKIAGQAGNDGGVSANPDTTFSVMPGLTGHLATADPAMIRKTARVIEATWGQVLWYDGRVCDARFSKCCGGALEEFKYCWENKEVPYLKYARDYASGEDVDLRGEQSARRWILSKPRAFCNTRSSRLLGQVLKDYDSETKDFYRWKVEYTSEELRQIILERTGEDYGQILDLIPLERGVSGRICRLKIVGSKKTKIIGKELEIRKTLSSSHLYSSAFIVEKVCGPEHREEKVCAAAHQSKFKSAAKQSFFEAAEGQTPAKFVLYGAGWGHGVGLCQIGAAAMGDRGYDYCTILAHYYPNSELKTLYGNPLPQDDPDVPNSHFVATKTPFSEETLPQDDSDTQNGHLVTNT